MNAQHARINAYFDACHDDYRRLWGLDRHLGMHSAYHDPRHRRHDEAVVNANRVLADLAAVRPDERVFDAGCGIGGSALWLARTVGCAVVGANINGRQLEQARKLAAEHRLSERVQFVESDFLAAPFAEASFDVVWALESACYAADKAAFAREAFRLLRPGGRLIVADAFAVRDDLAPHDAALIQRWADCWCVPNVWSVAAFGAALAVAGFAPVRWLDGWRYVGPCSRRMYWLSLACYPLGWLLERCGLRSPVQSGNLRAGFYQHTIRRRRLGLYAIFVARKPQPDGDRP